MPSPVDAAKQLAEKYRKVAELYEKHYVPGRSMLHVVAKKGHPELIDAAMDLDAKSGALVNIRTGSRGWTALQLVAEGGDDKFIRALLKHDNLDVNAKTIENGWTALQIAATAGRTSTVELLLSNHAKVNEEDKDGATALHAAARRGHTDVLKALVKKGAKIEAKTHDGETPLHLAARHGKEDAVRYLLKNHADKSVKVAKGKDKGRTPRELAIGGKHNQVADLLK